MILKVDHTFDINHPKQQLIVRYKQRILGLLISGNSICGYPGVGKTTLANELALILMLLFCLVIRSGKNSITSEVIPRRKESSL
jgi:predicted PilT family ATPase